MRATFMVTNARRILLLTTLAASLSVAQPPERPLAERAKSMVKDAIRTGGSHDLLASLCRTAPSRLSGSPGAARAVAWGRGQMARIGLEDVRLEPVTVPRWVRGETCAVSLRAPGGSAPAPLAAIALGGSVGTPPDGIEAEVVEVRHRRELRSLGRSGIDGRIVFFNQPFDNTVANCFTGYAATVWQRTQGAVEAARRGAVGVIVRSVTSMADDVPHTGAMRYAADVPRIPAAAVSVAAAERLAAVLAEGSGARVRMVMDCGTLDPVASANVVGEIPGRELPREIVLIGAHLDAWDVGHGAHDDGAGVAHVLEAARLILESGPAPRRTVRVVLFMNEENGLAGGRTYARTHAGELDRHVLALESDSGGFAPRGFGIRPARGFVEALAPVADVLADHDLGPIRSGRGGADISPLRPAGVPLMGLRTQTDRYFDLHHSSKDVLAAVHPRELARGAAAVAIVALAVADLEERLAVLAAAARK